MAFIVVYDANVLYPNALRDLLIRISQAGLVQGQVDQTRSLMRCCERPTGTGRTSRQTSLAASGS